MLTQLYVKTLIWLTDFKNDERGVTAIEYGLIGAAMASLIAALFATDGSLVEALNTVIGKITTALGMSTTA